MKFGAIFVKKQRANYNVAVTKVARGSSVIHFTIQFSGSNFDTNDFCLKYCSGVPVILLYKCINSGEWMDAINKLILFHWSSWL